MRQECESCILEALALGFYWRNLFPGGGGFDLILKSDLGKLLFEAEGVLWRPVGRLVKACNTYNATRIY